MNLQHRITTHLQPDVFPYAVGQGALGVEIRTGDERMIKLLASIEDDNSTWMCLSERAMLRQLQGGCSSPVGVHTTLEEKPVEEDGKVVRTDKQIKLQGRVVHPDGSSEVIAEATRIISSKAEAEALGTEVAQKLFDTGARELLAEIRQISTTFGKHPDQKQETSATS